MHCEIATVIEIVLSGGHGEGLQAEGDGREEHAQPIPEEHVRPHRGDKEPESVYEPVSNKTTGSSIITY